MKRLYRFAFCFLFLSGCADSDWSAVDLDTGFGFGAPLIGVDANAHCKLKLGKATENEDVAKPDDPAPPGPSALAELRFDAVHGEGKPDG